VTVIAGSAVIKGAQMEHEGKKQIQKQTEEYVRRQCEAMLVFDAHTEYTITVSTAKIHVLLKIQQDIPFGNMLKQFGWGDKLSYQTEKTALRLDPAAFIREIRRVDQLSRKAGK
jgi:hypothetical protein